MGPTVVVLALFASACAARPPAAAPSTPDFDKELAAYFERTDQIAAEGRFSDLGNEMITTPELSLFFERRQMYGWTAYKSYLDLITRLEAEEQKKNIAKTGKRDAARRRRTNVSTFAGSEIAYATFDVIEDRGSAVVSVDEALRAGDFERVTVIFRKLDGRWKVAHVHASYQAPPGPHWPVPKNTSSGALWDPNLQIEWQRKVCADFVEKRDGASPAPTR